MSINGVWSSEIGGAYGWEAIGTAFLEDGRLIGGGRSHYSFGNYKEEADGCITFHIEFNQFGEKRALFGRQSDNLSIVVKARQDDDPKLILGEATMPGHSEYGIAVRFKKRGQLPG